MSKEPGGFLRKVARFVANPTTDWTALNAPSTEAAESEYAKSEIKAMIERKRRNDFVRKRELDMLRKIRREGLSQDHAFALDANSNLDPDSRPQNGTRSDIAVKAKIDEIELQMVGSNRSTLQTSAGNLAPPVQVNERPGMPRMSDMVNTEPNLPRVLPPLAFELTEPGRDIANASAGSLQSSAFQVTGVPQHDSSNTNITSDLLLVELTHDPELDEAVIAFANADFDQCERCLLELMHPGAIRHTHSETWLVLFDLYRTLEHTQKFEQLAVSYAHQFGISAPQWFSYPRKVAQFLSQANAATNSAHHQDSGASQASMDEGPETEPGPDALPSLDLEGWQAPRLLDADAVAQLRVAMLQMPRPWVMDWRAVGAVSAEGARQLSVLMQLWARDRQNLVWMGVEQLLHALGDVAPIGVRDADQAFWMLKLDILRLCNRPVQFDEVAIDYCVTYELSPPSWEPAQCNVRLSQDSINAHTPALSRVSEVTTSFVESQIQHETSFVQVATLNLSGQLVGDIGTILGKLDTQLGGSVSLEIDCEHLLRVDFIAAGDLLNWVLARRADNRQVIFNNPHRLVAMFFGAMGINEHAHVKLRMN
jgi:hypothetical protein